MRRLRLPEGDLPRGSLRDHAAPAGRALARLEEHACPQLPRAGGDRVDVLHLDIRQPPGAGRAALDDAASDRAAEVDREVRPAADGQPLPAEAEQPGVEAARRGQVARVQLKMNDASCDGRLLPGSR